MPHFLHQSLKTVWVYRFFAFADSFSDDLPGLFLCVAFSGLTAGLFFLPVTVLPLFLFRNRNTSIRRDVFHRPSPAKAGWYSRRRVRRGYFSICFPLRGRKTNNNMPSPKKNVVHQCSYVRCHHAVRSFLFWPLTRKENIYSLPPGRRLRPLRL